MCICGALRQQARVHFFQNALIHIMVGFSFVMRVPLDGIVIRFFFVSSPTITVYYNFIFSADFRWLPNLLKSVSNGYHELRYGYSQQQWRILLLLLLHLYMRCSYRICHSRDTNSMKTNRLIDALCTKQNFLLIHNNEWQFFASRVRYVVSLLQKKNWTKFIFLEIYMSGCMVSFQLNIQSTIFHLITRQWYAGVCFYSMKNPIIFFFYFSDLLSFTQAKCHQSCNRYLYISHAEWWHLLSFYTIRTIVIL